MKFRSSPLTDASLNLAITLPLVFIAILLAQGLSAAQNQLTTVAALYLLPAYTLQSLFGIPLRTESQLKKFTMTTAVALVIAAFVLLIVVQGLAATNAVDPSLLLAQQQAWIFISVTYFVAQLFAAFVTHFLVTKQK